jgi:hypothetical protein
MRVSRVASLAALMLVAPGEVKFDAMGDINQRRDGEYAAIA